MKQHTIWKKKKSIEYNRVKDCRSVDGNNLQKVQKGTAYLDISSLQPSYLGVKNSISQA